MFKRNEATFILPLSSWCGRPFACNVERGLVSSHVSSYSGDLSN